MGTLKLKLILFLAMLCFAVAAGTSFWAVISVGKAKVLAEQAKALQSDLTQAQGTVEVLQADAKARARIDPAQAKQKAQATAAVQAVRGVTEKEKSKDETPAAVAAGPVLDRLRRLAEAGNDSIRTASKLPDAAE